MKAWIRLVYFNVHSTELTLYRLFKRNDISGYWAANTAALILTLQLMSVVICFLFLLEVYTDYSKAAGFFIIMAIVIFFIISRVISKIPEKSLPEKYGYESVLLTLLYFAAPAILCIICNHKS